MSKRLSTVQKVLELREHEAEQVELELARAREALLAERRRLEALDASLMQAIDNHDRAGVIMSSYEAGMFFNFCSDLQRRMKEQGVEIDLKMIALQQKQKALIRAHREKAVLQSLRDRILGEQRTMDLRAEQAEMDAMYLMRKGHDNEAF